MSLSLVETQGIMDWWPEERTDYPYTFGSDPWSESPEDELVISSQGEWVQSDLDVLEPEPVGFEDPQLIGFTHPNGPVTDILAFADIDLLASDCTYDGMRTISKKKKREMCPTTWNPSSSQVKEPECRPEGQICPVSKTAMCCIGQREAWYGWHGFSVGECIKCTSSP
jgi:hypothetical protein